MGGGTIASGQIALSGTVMTDSGEPAAFANVILTPVADTTRVLDAGLVDMTGHYALKKQRQGRYLVTISLVGYRTLREEVLLRTASVGAGTDVVRDFVLTADVEQIEGVVVRGSNVVQQPDRTVYQISREDRQRAYSALDLMEKVPQLRLDPLSQKLASQAGSVNLFINGVAASEQELKTLRPEDIKTIEYYDLPPMRYGGGDSKAVNVVTKGAVAGFYGGVDLSHGTSHSYFNDGLYLKYNRGKGQLMLRYETNYKNDKNIGEWERYAYTLHDVDYVKEATGRRHLMYFVNNINLQYTNQKQDNYIFQALASTNVLETENTVNTDIDWFVDEILNERTGVSRSLQHSVIPSLNLYLWKQLDKKQEIIANLVGTYFDAFGDNKEEEWMAEVPVLNDRQTMQNNKYSVIGEGMYSKHFGHVSLSVGEQFSYEHLASLIDNSFVNDRYVTELISTQTYAEVDGRHLDNKLQWRLSLGASGRYTGSREVEVWNWVFTPRLTVGYQILPTLLVRAGFSQYNTSPSLSQLNNSATLVSDNIIQRGNPYLKSGFANTTFLGLSYTNNWLAVYLTGSFQYAKNPINTYFVEGEQYMELVQENAYWSRVAGVNYNIQITPFANRILTLKLTGGVYYQQYDSPFAGRFDYVTYPLSYEVDVNWKNFTAFYQGALNNRYLNLPYLIDAQPVSNLGVRYRYKDWMFSATWIGLLIDWSYGGRTVGASVVQHDQLATYWNNRNMILIGVSFQFGKGRVYNEATRRVDNADRDSGL